MENGGEPDVALQPHESQRRIRVLIVDDDKVDRLALSRALAQTGLELSVRQAEGVLEAIETLTRDTYDCVLLDYHLNDGDGLTFLRGLRRAEITVYVVMITGQDSEQITGELMAAGAADYIPKSLLSSQRLLESLRRVPVER